MMVKFADEMQFELAFFQDCGDLHIFLLSDTKNTPHGTSPFVVYFSVFGVKNLSELVCPSADWYSIHQQRGSELLFELRKQYIRILLPISYKNENKF